MLTAFCFLFEWDNLFSCLSPLAIWEKSQYFKRAEALIEYFKQRKTDIAAWPLCLSHTHLDSSVLSSFLLTSYTLREHVIE